MRHRHFLITTAAASLLAIGQAHAQTSGDQQVQQAGQASGGFSGQRLAQERARYQGIVIYVSPADTRQITLALNNIGYEASAVGGRWERSNAAGREELPAGERS